MDLIVLHQQLSVLRSCGCLSWFCTVVQWWVTWNSHVSTLEGSLPLLRNKRTHGFWWRGWPQGGQRLLVDAAPTPSIPHTLNHFHCWAVLPCWLLPVSHSVKLNKWFYTSCSWSCIIIIKYFYEFVYEEGRSGQQSMKGFLSSLTILRGPQQRWSRSEVKGQADPHLSASLAQFWFGYLKRQPPWLI